MSGLEIIERAKRFIWLINKRDGGANEIDIFHLIDIYLSMYGDNYSKVFKTPDDEFRWLYNQVKTAIVDYGNKPLPVHGSKICAGCKELVALSNYHKNRRTSDGLKSRCKECSNEYQQQYFRDNPEKHDRYKKNFNKNRKKKYEL